MGWRDKLRAASFRGVPFKVHSHSAEPGARVVQVHEFPGSDEDYAEDIKLANGKYSITAHVDGEDYMDKRDALVRACQTKGAGTLVHPYFGELTVMCDGITVSESTEEGRIARITLSFVKAGRNAYPRAVIDTQGEVNLAADLATQATIEQFDQQFSVDGLPEFVSTGAQDIVSQALSEIEALLPGGLGFELPVDLGDITSRLPDLVRNPLSLGTDLAGLIGGVAKIPNVSMDGLLSFGGDLLPVPLTTATRMIQSANQSAIVSLVQDLGVIEFARNAASTFVEDRSSAFTLRDKTTDLLDAAIDMASELGNDTKFSALRDLSNTVSRAINQKAPLLGQVTDVLPNLTGPALVTAYRIYGDASRADELSSRNKLPHPGFVPGAQRLEVLTKAGEALPWQK